ncbi:hypothetical protein [Microlunatus sp. GCM10028923]|uniref:hypothetical protein n=1 Tax=Microlunatus sp. GCM10028923 TaxID=3273400 RepID=UPI00362288F0
MMYGPIAVILIAVGVFLGLILRYVDRAGDHRPAHEQARGFGLVGAGAAITLGGLVLIVGVLAPPNGTAETLGVLAVFGFVLYLVIAGTVIMVSGRVVRWSWGEKAIWGDRGSAAPQHPPYRQSGGDGAGHPADHRGPDQP